MIKEWLLKIGAGIVSIGVLILGVLGLRKYLLNRKSDKLVEDNNKDNKSIQEKLNKLDTQQQQVNVDIGKVDQQLEDLKNEKIDHQEIADFIDVLEKKAKE